MSSYKKDKSWEYSLLNDSYSFRVAVYFSPLPPSSNKLSFVLKKKDGGQIPCDSTYMRYLGVVKFIELYRDSKQVVARSCEEGFMKNIV